MSSLTLYPSNWLYNAGVIGFLQSVEHVEKINVKDWLREDGSVNLQLIFSKLDSEKRYFGQERISSIVGNNNLYINFLQPKQKEVFKEFVKALDFLEPAYCDICSNGMCLRADQTKHINEIDPAQKDNTKFLYRIKNFSIIHYSDLGPSLNEFPNAFWGLNQSGRVCHLCSFLIIHHHLAFTSLSDRSEIFINAPSFRVMYYLNKFAQKVIGVAEPAQARQKRDILAMSVMEYAIRIQTTLGLWAGMNIELISRRDGEIEFFSLPYEVTGLLSDRRIAGILTQIGELSILNLVLKQDYARLIEIAYHLLRIGTKPYAERKKTENDFIRKTLYLERNRANVVRVCQNIISLYALIQEKRRNL